MGIRPASSLESLTSFEVDGLPEEPHPEARLRQRLKITRGRAWRKCIKRLQGRYLAVGRGERGVLLGGALLLIFPGAISDILGMACLAAVWLAQRKAPAVVPRPAA